MIEAIQEELYGINRGNCEIYNCYNLGEVKVTSNKGEQRWGWASGGILGLNWERTCDIKNVYNLYEQPNYGGKYVGTVNIENDFYINKQEKYTKEYIISENFVTELNEYIENNTLAEEKCCKWVQSKNGYPMLDFNTIWNGTDWVKNKLS